MGDVDETDDPSDDAIPKEIHATRRRLLEKHGEIAGLAACICDPTELAAC